MSHIPATGHPDVIQDPRRLIVYGISDRQVTFPKRNAYQILRLLEFWNPNSVIEGT